MTRSHFKLTFAGLLLAMLLASLDQTIVATALANLSGEPARYVLVCTPAGFERYFARMEAEQAGDDPPEWALQDWPTVTRVGPRIGE